MQNPVDRIAGHDLFQNNGRLWAAIVLAVLVAATGYSLIRVSSQEQQRTELLRSNQALQASLDQAKSQLQSASEELNAAKVQAPPVQSEPVAANAPENPAPPKPVHKAKKASSHPANSAHPVAAHPVNDPRWGEMDAKLADQQKQIESTRSDIEKSRQDMEGRLGSTRDELNGSIARTHDEIVELRKRGERNYYEFDLKKSSQYERTGPVSLSLRKTNVKHKYFDIALIVDDQKIEKKHVNLFEPLWISVPDRPEPVQVVVNGISKENIKGYLSEPKYKKSELAKVESAKAAANSAPASQTDSDTGTGKPLQPR
jgi:type II secretory pathway pseudopilin PulG